MFHRERQGISQSKSIQVTVWTDFMLSATSYCPQSNANRPWCIIILNNNSYASYRLSGDICWPFLFSFSECVCNAMQQHANGSSAPAGGLKTRPRQKHCICTNTATQRKRWIICTMCVFSTPPRTRRCSHLLGLEMGKPRFEFVTKYSFSVDSNNSVITSALNNNNNNNRICI